MNERENNRQRISRRAVLGGAALTLGAATEAAMIRPAAAQPTISQSIAKYQGTPNAGNRCGICGNFQPPNACKFVQGEISPNGWCQLFSPKA